MAQLQKGGDEAIAAITGVETGHTSCVNCVVRLSDIASTVSPLYRYFSFSVGHSNSAKEPYVPPCIRCPNCKGCQLHLQFCSGAYGLRHVLAWILHRQPPKAGESRTIKLHCDTGKDEGSSTLSRCSVCRFEVGPVVITRHIIHCSLEQTMETSQRGGRTGTFAGMACPRPLNFIDVYYSIFLGTTQNGREKKRFRVLQRTAMRAVAAEARALWEKLTFSHERYNEQRSEEIKAKAGKVLGPRRVPVDWRCPPFFFSLLPCAPVGNGGLTFVLWLCELGRHIITSYIVEDGEFWRSKHTCTSEKETDTAECVSTSAPVLDLKRKGEAKCRRCYAPGICWGLIYRRHREDRVKMLTILCARRGCTKRRIARRAI
ncbi:hypothetical protein TraAM80_07301 [Trypanosoma rangeli]|uniref:Uncharacterized protein n=1 Tax=Trypanosoma rangeli TaxID=5698 RepID=A0A3R7LPL1_TRYRA|nr:uncharacterized protein TraAM80_07301 [Trypanosoma rangeli]RNF00964.1 hypothetical protein TraAM80_07301 [Trypanosoma rangeli]|eukprot:RNF00964.1 hypothetical protein TraAM80_07301 [Trypanosoma rangeli]